MGKMKFDLSAYLVLGPENCLGRPVAEVVRAAVEAGFTFVQIRSKVASARELIQLTGEAADALAQLGKENQVALVVDDRLDVVLAARALGYKVDGIHVGQSDIPVDVCRRYLGDHSIVGLSARTDRLFEYVETADLSLVDYLGAGPLHETETKPDCGLYAGKVHTRSFEELSRLAKASPLPVVVGGGVKLDDLEELAQTAVAGFFVVTAVTHAANPKSAAAELVSRWREGVAKKNQ